MGTDDEAGSGRRKPKPYEIELDLDRLTPEHLEREGRRLGAHMASQSKRLLETAADELGTVTEETIEQINKAIADDWDATLRRLGFVIADSERAIFERAAHAEYTTRCSGANANILRSGRR
jgi:hypothetical protein